MEDQTPKQITVTLDESEWEVIPHALLEHGDSLSLKLKHPSILVRFAARALLQRMLTLSLKMAAQLEKQGA